MDLGSNAVSKKRRVTLTQPQLPQLGNRSIDRPKIDSGASAAEESSQASISFDAEPDLKKAFSDNHNSSLALLTVSSQAVYAVQKVSSRAMDTLSELIERAMSKRGMDAPAVAKLAGLTKQSVYNVVSGETKWDKIRAVTLFGICRALGTYDALSLYQAPQALRLIASQTMGIDAGILVEAEKLVAIEESITGRPYKPEEAEARMRRIAALYGDVLADGGQLTRQHMGDFIQAAQQQVSGAGDGSDEIKAIRGKAAGKR